MAALGSCLISENALQVLAGMLQPEHFALPQHKAIFAAMLDAMEGGQRVSYMSVVERIRRAGLEPVTNAPDVLIELASYVPSASGCAEYGRIVLDYWALREYAEIGAAALIDGASPDDLALRCERVRSATALSAPPKSGPIGSFVGSRPKRGIPCGIQMIDDGTVTRGLPEGQMVVIGAYTGGGKSAFMLQLAANIAAGGPVLYATFADLTAEDIADRLVKQRCSWSHEPKSEPMKAAYREASDAVRDLDLTIYDPSELRTGRDVETFCTWVKAQRPFRAVFVDYAQEVRSRSKSARTELDHADEVSSQLRWLAADLRAPVVVGSQITEGSAGARDITKGSRRWEERAGLYIRLRVLSEDERLSDKRLEAEYRTVEGLTLAMLAKNRFGRTARQWWRWDASRVLFEEL